MKLFFASIVIWQLAPSSMTMAQEFGTCERPVGEAYLDANNVRARILNTGTLFRSGNPSVYEVPQGSDINAIWKGALWFGGIVNEQIRTSATEWRDGDMWAGPLEESGQAPDNCHLFDRVYKVDQSDVDTYEMTGYASNDLQDWPTGLGAPSIRADGTELDLTSLPLSTRKNRKIDLVAGERPAIRGSQSVWWVMNDRGNEHQTPESSPMGIEVHGLAFAADGPNPAAYNTTLYNFRIFNRNAVPITEAYAGIWLDTELGDIDDRMGSDSTLGLGYTYNADNLDEGNYGVSPPALGMMVVKGPHAQPDGQDNDGDGQIDEVGERLRTTTVGTRYSGGCVTCDPYDGEDFYNYLRGRWKDGQPFTIGGQGRDFSTTPTRWFFSGDPVTASFWSETNIDGQGTTGNPPTDRKWWVSSGPFTLAPGDDTDFTVAIVWARGVDHLDSITELKLAAAQVQQAFDLGAWGITTVGISTAESPSPKSTLLDNYPDPFYDTTSIKYRLQNVAHVRLSVFDLIGREVQILVNQIKTRGDHVAVFSGDGLRAGVYFYRIEIGRDTETLPMILLK